MRIVSSRAKESIVSSSLWYKGQKIVATLTTLAVDSQFRNRGIGHQLVGALEGFFAAEDVLYYRLETLLRNEAAHDLYRNLGFREAGRRAGSFVLVKRITA
jgi:ribosomal protein S18 acetylase RimI-like enzyme